MEHPGVIADMDGGACRYRGIPISIVRLGRVYDFDIYLKVRETYRLFAAKGILLTMDHLTWRSRREMEFFVREEEWSAARKSLTQDIGAVLTNPGIQDRHKANLVFSSAMQSIRHTYQGKVPKTISDIEMFADDQVKLILADSLVLENLRLMTKTDHFTFQHSVRVGIFATALLRKLMGDRLTRDQIMRISAGFFLHDIGMAEVPIEIIKKPGRLSGFEMMLIQMHPVWGRERISRDETLSREAVSIILSHHERSDGRGYPLGKKGKEIPLSARICTITDTFEAMTAGRPYRKPLSPFEALQTMYQEMAHEFDPDLFMAFVKLLGPDA